MPMNVFNGRVSSLFAGGAIALACGAVVISAQTVAPESFTALVSRLQQGKPTFAKRQQDLLAARYDLADRAAPGVTMSRGKAVQDSPEPLAGKLPANASSAPRGHVAVAAFRSTSSISTQAPGPNDRFSPSLTVTSRWPSGGSGTATWADERLSSRLVA